MELTPRQQRIAALLDNENILSAVRAQELIGASRPTVYRDFAILVEAGLARRAPGGLLRSLKMGSTSVTGCCMCQRNVSPRTAFLIYREAESQITACCPHCGVMAMSLTPNISAALATDFIYGAMISVQQAFFLVNSRVTLCCLPSALAFGSEADALGFQLGFGGEIVGIARLQEHIHARSAPRSRPFETVRLE